MSRVALGVLILTVDMLAVAGNATVIIAFILNKKLRKPSGCYVTNLAAADFCMSIFGIPFYVATVFLNRWPFGDYFCAVWTCLEKVVSLVSNFAIVAICFDRYWLVTKSSDYLSRHSVRKACNRIGIIWLSAILLRVPFVIFGIYRTWKKQAQLTPCDPRSIYDVPLKVGLYGFDASYTLVTALCEFGVPLLLVIIWGAQVYVYLESREKKRLMKAMKVERSRAMSVDFCMAEMEPQQIRHVSSGKSWTSTFWSNLRTRDCQNQVNLKTRSQDTIAGALSDLDEKPVEDNVTGRNLLLKSSRSLPFPVPRSEISVSGKSIVNITLDPAESITGDLVSSMDIPTADTFMRTSLSCNDINVTTSNNSSDNLIQSQRRASSLDTLQVPSFTLGRRRRFSNRTATPSVILSIDGHDRDQADHDGRHRNSADSGQCAANDGLNLQQHVGGFVYETIHGNEQPPEKKMAELKGNLRDSSENDLQSLARTNGSVRRPFVSESFLPCCDFLEVPSMVTPRPLFSLDAEGPPDGFSAESVDSMTLENPDVHQTHARTPSFGSSVSDLPDSISSMMTVSEPPSPSLPRFRGSSDGFSFGGMRGMGRRAKKRYYAYKRRALFTIILMICVFIVFQLPYLAVSTMYSFCYGDCISDTLYEAANWWYWAKVVLNPFLYAYISPEFRRYSLALIKCKHKRKLR